MKRPLVQQTCVYCGLRPGTTADHVLARGFVAIPDRGNLPKVPSCSDCNNAKAALEHHLATVLPFGAVHGDAARFLAEEVPRRLAKNAKLHRRLADGMREESYTDASGNASTRLVLPFDGARLEALFSYITRGLIYVHWGRYLDHGYVARAMAMREAGQHHWEALMTHPTAAGQFGWSLGNRVLRYEAFHDSSNLNVSGWQFRMFGGMSLAEGDDCATMIIGQSVRFA